MGESGSGCGRNSSPLDSDAAWQRASDVVGGLIDRTLSLLSWRGQRLAN